MMVTNVSSQNANLRQQYFEVEIENFGNDPITFDKIKNPVVVSCGHTLEREIVEIAFLRARNSHIAARCPHDQIELNENIMIPNKMYMEGVAIVKHMKKESDDLKEEVEELKNSIKKIEKVLNAPCCPIKTAYDFWDYIRIGFNAADRGLDLLIFGKNSAFYEEPQLLLENEV